MENPEIALKESIVLVRCGSELTGMLKKTMASGKSLSVGMGYDSDSFFKIVLYWIL